MSVTNGESVIRKIHDIFSYAVESIGKISIATIV